MPSEYTSKRVLTRHGMEQAIAKKGSVIHKGQIITAVVDLPTEADLAGDDTQARQQALDNLAQQQRAIDEQRAKLLGASPSQQAAPPPPAAKLKTLIAADLVNLGLDDETMNALLQAQQATDKPLTDEELDAVPNVGPATVSRIREAQAARR